MPRFLDSARPEGLFLHVVDRNLDHFLGLFRAGPVFDLDPFAGFEILVVLEEMLDLFDEVLGQILISLDVIIMRGQLAVRNSDDFLVLATIVFHDQNANRRGRA